MKPWRIYALAMLGILLVFNSSLFAGIRYDSTEISLGGTHTFVEGDPAFIKSLGIGVQPAFAFKAHPNDLFFASLRYFYNFDRYANLFDTTKTDYLHTFSLSLGMERKKGIASMALGLGGEVDLLHNVAGITAQPTIIVHITPRILLPIGDGGSLVLAPELVGRYVFGKEPAHELEGRVSVGFRFSSKSKTAVPPPSAVTATSAPLIPSVPTVRSVAAMLEAETPQPVVVEMKQSEETVPTVDPVVRKEQIRRLWWLLGRP
ncbi:MAG TPA: hypothetical protein PLW47_01345 [Sphaerochaeta sp.]|nr:hypothetical protein [Sphaerochaeta sp.]